MAYLLFPCLQLFDQKVVPLCDFGKLRVHSAFEVDEVLPRFHCISGVLVALTNDFVQVSHRHFRHQWLFYRSSKECFDSGVPAL